MNITICAIAKNENVYLYEWASYHLALGFSHIFIYDNNDIDGERIEDVFSGTAIEFQITIIDVRGKKYFQKEAYNDCYKTQDFDWCAFIDIDEFITFTKKSGITSIKQFLQDKRNFEAVHLNWLCYGDSGHVRYKEGNVVDRFTKPIRPINYQYAPGSEMQNCQIKSIIRKGLPVDWTQDSTLSPSNPHTPFGLTKICNPIGKSVNNSPFNPICHEVAFIRHYKTKTIEEYRIKIERQCADCDSKPYSYKGFFDINFPSFGKLMYLKKTYGEVDSWEYIKYYFRFCIIRFNLPLRFLFRSLKK